MNGPLSHVCFFIVCWRAENKRSSRSASNSATSKNPPGASDAYSTGKDSALLAEEGSTKLARISPFMIEHVKCVVECYRALKKMKIHKVCSSCLYCCCLLFFFFHFCGKFVCRASFLTQETRALPRSRSAANSATPRHTKEHNVGPYCPLRNGGCS